jgi:homoserine kinase
VPHEDAAANSARSALLVAALLDGGPALLAATEDRLHQPYRAESMPASAALVDKLRAAGLAAVVSGAGPTVLVLARDELEAEAVLGAAPTGWRCLPLSVDLVGAHVVANVR